MEQPLGSYAAAPVGMGASLQPLPMAGGRKCPSKCWSGSHFIFGARLCAWSFSSL